MLDLERSVITVTVHQHGWTTLNWRLNTDAALALAHRAQVNFNVFFVVLATDEVFLNNHSCIDLYLLSLLMVLNVLLDHLNVG